MGRCHKDWQGDNCILLPAAQTARETRIGSLALAYKNSHTVSIAVRWSSSTTCTAMLPFPRLRQALLLEMGEGESATALSQTVMHTCHLLHRAYDRQVTLLERIWQAVG